MAVKKTTTKKTTTKKAPAKGTKSHNKAGYQKRQAAKVCKEINKKTSEFKGGGSNQQCCNTKSKCLKPIVGIALAFIVGLLLGILF